MDSTALLAQVQVRPNLLGDFGAAQEGDSEIQKVKQKAKSDSDFRVDNDVLLRFRDRLVIPPNLAQRAKLLDIAHASSYVMHPGIAKMYHDLKQFYWWDGMKRDVADFVSRCLTCQQVNAEHQKLVGTL